MGRGYRDATSNTLFLRRPSGALAGVSALCRRLTLRPPTADSLRRYTAKTWSRNGWIAFLDEPDLPTTIGWAKAISDDKMDRRSVAGKAGATQPDIPVIADRTPIPPNGLGHLAELLFTNERHPALPAS